MLPTCYRFDTNRPDSRAHPFQHPTTSAPKSITEPRFHITLNWRVLAQELRTAGLRVASSAALTPLEYNRDTGKSHNATLGST